MSTSPFKKHIREKIADQTLQSALDNNTARRLQVRAAAVSSLPDWTQRRQRAHRIRAEVIDHLEHYVAQFTRKVTENGIRVHRARNAAEAAQIVLEIVNAAPHQGPSALIAKSKSMVSEEIELNHALEAAGHRVVETDLGEYIIQLRGERPSHIITPAMHLRRQQVGALFAEKLSIPYTEDISTLTNTARRVLRQVFLTADIGISGVNFGVAETGTLTLVTNEGNGRMVTTLPPVHIALMGMERLLPTLDDLALFLSLLPRSATGQKLSVYTQLIHAPENGQQKHLVIVDNGREAMRQSPLREALYCIRCGACLNACPVFREIGGHAYVDATGSIAPYPGPIGSVVSPGLGGSAFAHLAQASTLCGACKDACPVDIDLPMLLTRVRANMLPVFEERKPAPAPGVGLSPLVKLGLSAYARLAAHPRLFAAAQKAAGLAAQIAAPAGWLRLPAFTGWGFSKDMPRPEATPFREKWTRLKRQPIEQNGAKEKVENRQEAASPTPASNIPNLAERFAGELGALGGNVSLLQAKEVTAAILSLLHERGIDRVQAWDFVPGLDAARLAESGIRVESACAPEIRAGLTGALAAIAETGTLVVPGGAGFPLTASLVPEIHIAVLARSALVDTLEAALRLPGVAAAPAVALITGPSRTADIEMTLTIGVHGPGQVHVFVLMDQ